VADTFRAVGSIRWHGIRTARFDGRAADPRGGRDGREVVDGREAVRIATRDGRIVYLVDATTYIPIEWRTTGDGGSSSLRFNAYETLPATPENLALLDVRVQHPDATVDTDPEHFRDAQARLYPNG
jgi:hypothetical protein